MQSTIDKETALNKASAHRTPGSAERVSAVLPRFFVPAFALMFLTFALLLASSSAFELIRPMLEEGDFFTGLVKGLNIGVVALAVYELAQIVYQEYDHNHELRDVMARTRRGVSRFGSVVVVALVLESLIMVIKYSQQDLAGFLFYPATLILSAAVLLAALGLFARLTDT